MEPLKSDELTKMAAMLWPKATDAELVLLANKVFSWSDYEKARAALEEVKMRCKYQTLPLAEINAAVQERCRKPPVAEASTRVYFLNRDERVTRNDVNYGNVLVCRADDPDAALRQARDWLAKEGLPPENYLLFVGDGGYDMLLRERSRRFGRAPLSGSDIPF